jgi:hypothetical protein
MKKGLLLVAGAGWVAVSASAQVVTSSPLFPPLTGEYVAAGSISFGSGAHVVSGLTLLGITGGGGLPTGIYVTYGWDFPGIQLYPELSLDGGPFTLDPTQGSANIGSTAGGSQLGAVDTYPDIMAALNLSGLPNGDMLRISPTLPSTGQTTVTDLGGGQFQVSSFFDVFTEISLDGGNTWTPNDGGSTRLNLEPLPEPGTVALATLGGLGVCLLRRRR